LVGATFSVPVSYAVISSTHSAVVISFSPLFGRFIWGLFCLAISWSLNMLLVNSLSPSPHRMHLLYWGLIAKWLTRHHLLSSCVILVKRENACLLKGRDDIPGTHGHKISRACHAGDLVLRDSFAHMLPRVICALAVVVALKKSENGNI